MKEIASGKGRKPKASESQYREIDTAKSSSSVSKKDSSPKPTSSNSEIATSENHPVLPSGTDSPTPADAVGNRSPSSPSDTIAFANHSSTSTFHAPLPPLISWKHALIPLHSTSKGFDSAPAHENLQANNGIVFQPTGLFSVVEADAHNTHASSTPKLVGSFTKSPTLPLPLPQSSLAKCDSSSPNSIPVSSPTTLPPDSPGCWRRSASHNLPTQYQKLLAHGVSQGTATPFIPLDPKFSRPWRQSGIKENLTEPVPVPKSKYTPVEILPDDINCSIFIVNILPGITASEILDHIHCGTVRFLHVFPPIERNPNQAAKLVFTKSDSAARLVNHAKGPYHCFLRGTRLYVSHNQDGSRAYDGPETRVLLVEGPTEAMTPEYWRGIFDKSCFEMLDRWRYRACASAGRTTMEFRFLSISVAKSCYGDIMLCHGGTDGGTGFFVSFGRDACDTSHLKAWAAPN